MTSDPLPPFFVTSFQMCGARCWIMMAAHGARASWRRVLDCVLFWQYSIGKDMRDKNRLMITGIVALGAVAVTLAGHRVSTQIGGGGGGWWGRNHDRPPVTTNYGSLRNFDGVTLQGPDNVVVTQGKDFAVRTEGDRAALKELHIYVKDGTLIVSRRDRSDWFGNGNRDDATIHVTLPALARATLTGSGDMKIDRLSGDQVRAVLTGPGNLAVDELTAQDAQINLTGSGDIMVRGKVHTATLSTTGSGDLRAGGLEAETATLRLVGSGDVQAHASRKADISIQGSGDAQLRGTTECRISKMGSGEANCST